MNTQKKCGNCIHWQPSILHKNTAGGFCTWNQVKLPMWASKEKRSVFEFSGYDCPCFSVVKQELGGNFPDAWELNKPTTRKETK